MNMKAWLVALALSSSAFAAFAHSGAMGVTKERMDAMGEMGDAMKRLTPMMRGETDYDPQVVRDAADVMIRHSGSQMTELFPEGSNGAPSEALDKIWEDWDAFSALADALADRAEGMKRAAENDLAGPDAAPTGGMMGNNQAMMGGAQGMMGQGHSMMSGGPGEMMSADLLAEMPVSAGFMAVTQTCSACHQTFRAKKK
ncbi:c-type cytochrome [Palleronia caenipelagi]|uniref:Cytochrome c n=1 Tax=Palleronia caenipelagi TaxID=2489174 RepID=A0A547PLX5_9RHOB|nr:cytochrome c [Palleronia caenipelagi]TRD15149.1 cytochrome c [Palleronia caenipelagi]